METARSKSRGISSSRHLAAALLLTATAVLFPSLGMAQQGNPPQTRSPRAREALRAAQECYRQGDYETAAQFYQDAEANKQQLNAAEQADLATQMKANTVALIASRDGAVHLRQAAEAVQQGKLQEASALVRAESANQYLQPGDKARLTQLTEQLRALGAGSLPAGAPTAPAVQDASKEDYRSLLTMARNALLRGDVDTAEALGLQAEAKAGKLPSWVTPWNDSHQKVLRDAKTAREKSVAGGPGQPPPSAQDSKNDPAIVLTSGGTKVKTMYGPGAGQPVPDTNGLPPLSDGNLVVGHAANSPAQQGKGIVSKETLEARMLREKAIEAIANNDLMTAKKYAEQAKVKADPNSWWDRPTPDELLRSINNHLGNGGHNGTAAAGTAPTAAPSAPMDANSARATLKEARALYSQGKLDDADRLCAMVAGAKLRWGLFEDNPDKLRDDIKSVRNKSGKVESAKALAEGRKLLAAGHFQEARANAWRAKHLHGPYGLLDLGDRPERLLADIDAAEARSKKQGSGAAVAKKNQQPSGLIPVGLKSTDDQPAPIPYNAMLARQRADALLEEARAYHKQGQLLEAQVKAVEARNAALEAIKAGLTYGPNEESPDLLLYAISSQAKSRIETLVRHAEDNAGGAADPARLKLAADSLAEARQWAQRFGLDTMAIDIKLAWVSQRQGNPAGLTPAITQQTGPKTKGQQLLDDSRREIQAGRLEMARKIAEEAFDTKYGVQAQAEAVLHDIDVEVFNQKRLDSERAFVAANEAYQRQDYARARAIMAQVDQGLVTEQTRLRLREMALSPAMQFQKPAESLKLAGGQIVVDSPGKASVTDMAQPGAKQPETADFQSYRSLLEVEHDRLVKSQLSALKIAQQRAETGDLDGALEKLRMFTAELSASGLEPDQVASLGKSVDHYVKQYQTLKAQKEFQKEQNSGLGNGRENEKQRMIKDLETRTEVSQLIDRAGQLMREGKFGEANVVYHRAKDLDPENQAAAMGIFQSNIKGQEKYNEEVKRNKGEMFLHGLDDNPGPYVDIRDPMHFDNRFVSKAGKRKTPLFVKNELKDPIERDIDRKLWEKKVTLSFNNVSLYNCIEDVKRYVDVNIVTDDFALKAAGIRLDQPVTMNVNEMNLRSALNHLLSKANLTFVIQNQAITITTEDRAKGDRITWTHSVADLVIPVENKKSPQGALIDARWQKAINDQLYGHGINYAPTPFGVPGGLPPGQPVGNGMSGYQAPGQPGQIQKPAGQPLEELLISLIKNTIAPDSWSEAGGKGTIQYYPLGMALVVGQQTPDIQEQIVDLLQALRRLQDLEVAIEMRLVSVSEAFFEFMGVDFDLNILHSGGARDQQVLLSGVFAPPGFINQFRPSSFFSGITPAGTFTPDLGVPIRASSFDFALPPFGGYPGTLGADGGISLGLAFLSDIQVKMFLEAAQGDRRTNVMQAPKITVFNGQTATINVGDELTFLDGINVVQVGGGQTVFQPVQNRVPYGIFMNVTPVVSADRRFVRLNLTPQLQNLVSATVPLLPVQQIVPQLFYDNISPPQPAVFQLFFQQPSTSFITLNTTVVVPDGGTVLMGGLKTLVEARNEFGPPVLSKIPYINRLFTNVGYGREAQSLMIMVTARIIINEEEELEFLGQLQRIPR